MTARQQHTPEPWKIESVAAAMSTNQRDYLITYSDGELRSHIARLFDNSLCSEHGTTEANARRIVACVNFCAGIETDQLTERSIAGVYSLMRTAQEQRNELAEVLRALLDEQGRSYDQRREVMLRAANVLATL